MRDIFNWVLSSFVIQFITLTVNYNLFNCTVPKQIQEPIFDSVINIYKQNQFSHHIYKGNDYCDCLFILL